MRCNSCGVSTLAGDECAFCLGSRLKRDSENASAYLASHGVRCGICKQPVEIESEVNSVQSLWRSRGKLVTHWTHKGACYELASRKVSFMTLRAHALKQALDGQNRVKPDWYQKAQRDKQMAKVSARELGRDVIFYAYPPRAPGGVGTFVVGKVESARLQPPTPDKPFEKGSIRIHSRVGYKVKDETKFVDITVNWDDISVARFVSSRLDAKGPGNPGIKGQYIGILYARLNTRGDRSYHNPEVFVSSDLAELIAEMNADPSVALIRAMDGWEDFSVDHQTWFDGSELKFGEFIRERGEELGIHVDSGDEIPF